MIQTVEGAYAAPQIGRKLVEQIGRKVFTIVPQEVVTVAHQMREVEMVDEITNSASASITRYLGHSFGPSTPFVIVSNSLQLGGSLDGYSFGRLFHRPPPFLPVFQLRNFNLKKNFIKLWKVRRLRCWFGGRRKRDKEAICFFASGTWDSYRP